MRFKFDFLMKALRNKRWCLVLIRYGLIFWIPDCRFLFGEYQLDMTLAKLPVSIAGNYMTKS